jgi:hypothetical protein
MGRRGLVWAVCVGLVAACSAGGGGSATSRTTTSSTTSTSAPTTTTSPEDAVKAAYLAYWKMADRLFGAPDPDDPELSELAVEPLLSKLKDQLSTKRSEGHRYIVSAGRRNDHVVLSVSVDDGSGEISDCFVDGRTEVDSSNGVVDNAVATKLAQATLALDGMHWKVKDVQFVQETEGVSGCAM